MGAGGRIKPRTAHLLEGGQNSMFCGGEKRWLKHNMIASGVKGLAAAVQEEAEAESPEDSHINQAPPHMELL